MEISRKCPKKAQKASTLPRHLCPVGANGAMTKRHETVGAIAKRPLDAPRYYSGHGEGPTSSIRPPSHAWRARQDGKSGRRGASGTKRPLGRSAAPTESPLHAPRACPTLRDSLSPHAGIGGNAWGTAPRSKRRPNVGRLQHYETGTRGLPCFSERSRISTRVTNGRRGVQVTVRRPARPALPTGRVGAGCV
jgi:hypothetical protein